MACDWKQQDKTRRSSVPRWCGAAACSFCASFPSVSRRLFYFVLLFSRWFVQVTVLSPPPSASSKPADRTAQTLTRQKLQNSPARAAAFLGAQCRGAASVLQVPLRLQVTPPLRPQGCTPRAACGHFCGSVWGCGWGGGQKAGQSLGWKALPLVLGLLSPLGGATGVLTLIEDGVGTPDWGSLRTPGLRFCRLRGSSEHSKCGNHCTPGFRGPWREAGQTGRRNHSLSTLIITTHGEGKRKLN